MIQKVGGTMGDQTSPGLPEQLQKGTVARPPAFYCFLRPSEYDNLLVVFTKNTTFLVTQGLQSWPINPTLSSVTPDLTTVFRRSNSGKESKSPSRPHLKFGF
jgi:hypothetical protein